LGCVELVGWAQPILDFVFCAHTIRPVYVVGGFDLKASITLIVLSADVGFVLGYAGALIEEAALNFDAAPLLLRAQPIARRDVICR
jgi:hypothetical protein